MKKKEKELYAVCRSYAAEHKMLRAFDLAYRELADPIEALADWDLLDEVVRKRINEVLSRPEEKTPSFWQKVAKMAEKLLTKEKKKKNSYNVC